MGKEGTWWLRSKKDGRWDRSGQSGACDASAMPPEAEAALAELRRALGEEPPDDLRYTFMPNKPGNRLSRLHTLCAAHAALSSEKQRALAASLAVFFSSVTSRASSKGNLSSLRLLDITDAGVLRLAPVVPMLWGFHEALALLAAPAFLV